MHSTVKQKVPVIVALPGSRLNMISCEIKGNDDILNAGLISLNADLLLSHCKFTGFKAGGVLI